MLNVWTCPYCGRIADQHEVLSNGNDIKLACVIDQQGNVSQGKIGFIVGLIDLQYGASLDGSRLVVEKPMRERIDALNGEIDNRKAMLTHFGDRMAALEEELKRHPPPAAAIAPLLTTDERSALDEQVAELRQSAQAADQPAQCHQANCKHAVAHTIAVTSPKVTFTVRACDNAKHVSRMFKLAEEQAKGARQ